MKKILLIVFIFISCIPYVFAQDILSKTLSYKNYILKTQRNYLILANVLNLSQNQRNDFEQIYQKNFVFYENNLDKLLDEGYKIKALDLANASIFTILIEKNKYNEIKNAIEKFSKKENKNIEKILTREQKSKFSMIKRLERKDYKSKYEQKDFYKTNPQLEHFGKI